MQLEYDDFRLLVTEDGRIRAYSEEGEASADILLEMNEIRLALELVDQTQTNADLLKTLGSKLYRSLFPSRIGGRFSAARARAEAADRGVRLRLELESAELRTLPWEFLYDEDTSAFLANDVQTPLSRYIDVPLSKRDLRELGRPLRILLIISSPTDLAALDAPGEERLIREALRQHIETGQIEVEALHEATIRNINQKLREKPYHVLHFIGHGVFADGKGSVALVDANHRAQLLDEERFASFFLGNRTLGLAMLNACQTATTSSRRVLAGVAASLVQRGIPAVVAMQYAVSDSTAKLFADEFYRTLALGWPVDAAVQTTRNAIFIEVGSDKADFATPVLFMRAANGEIFGT